MNRRAVTMVLVFGAAGLLPASIRAQAARAGTIVVTAPWLRATPKTAPVAGGYATITNTGAAADRLIGASLPIAPKGEVHTMTMQDGMMHMSRLDEGLAIAPGAVVVLSPGGDHLMFLKPSAPLKEGQSIPGVLIFEKAGRVDVTFAVGGMAAKTAPGARPTGGAAMRGTDAPSMDMKGMGMNGMDMKGMDTKGSSPTGMDMDGDGMDMKHR